MAGPDLLHAESFRPEGKDDAVIFNGFRVWLRSSLVAHGITHAAIEEPLRTDLSVSSGVEVQDGGDLWHPGSKPTFAKRPIGTMRTFLRLYGLRAHAVEIFYSLNIDFVEVNNKTWRSAIYGPCSPPKTVPADRRSEWWKQKALAHCKTLHWPIKSRDAAEAALICDWLRSATSPIGRTTDPDLFGTAA